MALIGTEYGKAVMDEDSFYIKWLTAAVMREAQRHRKPVVFVTQALEAKIARSFPVMHYDRGQMRTLFGIPFKIVYDPGVCACWVGELVYEEREDAQGTGKD